MLELSGTPSDVSIAELRSEIEAIRGVAGVHDLHTALGNLLSRVGDYASRRFPIAIATVRIELPGWKCGGIHD